VSDFYKPFLVIFDFFVAWESGESDLFLLGSDIKILIFKLAE